MRVIAGRAKGKKLEGGNLEGTRPLMDRIKESIFERLSPRLPGGRVLDLFAGTGSIGIEALSRGAASACFVESSPEAIKLLRRNVEQAGFRDQAEIICQLSERFLMTSTGEYDIIFIDPPFADFQQVIEGLLDAVRQQQVLAEEGLTMVRHFFKDRFKAPGYARAFEKKYGENNIVFLKRGKEGT